MATLDVNVNPAGAVTGAAIAESALDKIKVAAVKTEASMISLGEKSNRVGTAFAALTASFAIGGILKASDAYTVVNNRLRLVSESQAQLAETYKAVYQIAQDTRAPLEGTAKFYSQIALNAKSLKLSQQDLITVTTTLNKVIALTGQSAEASNNALIQLQQAMGSGVLRGDELRSIMEQLPLLGQIIADKMKIPVGALKSYGEQGLISAKIVTDALKASAADIDKAFAQTKFTFGQAFTVLYNGFVNFIGVVNAKTGIFDSLARAIAYVGKEMMTVVTVMGVFAAAFAAIKISSFIASMNAAAGPLFTYSKGVLITTATMNGWSIMISSVIARLAALRVAVFAFALSNPFTAVIAGIGLLIGLIYTLSGAFSLAGLAGTTVGQMLTSAWNGIVVALAYVANFIVGSLTPVFAPLSAAVQAVWLTLQVLGQILYSMGEAIVLVVGAFFELTGSTISWTTVGQATVFILTSLVEGFAILIQVGLTPFVVAMYAAAETMAALGLVAPETANKLGELAAKMFDYSAYSEENRAKIALNTTENAALKTMLDSLQGILTSTTAGFNNLSSGAGDAANGVNKLTGATREYYRTAFDATSQSITGAQMYKNLQAVTIDVANAHNSAASSAHNFAGSLSQSSSAAASAANSYRDLANAAKSAASASSTANSVSSSGSKRSSGGTVLGWTPTSSGTTEQQIYAKNAIDALNQSLERGLIKDRVSAQRSIINLEKVLNNGIMNSASFLRFDGYDGPVNYGPQAGTAGIPAIETNKLLKKIAEFDAAKKAKEAIVPAATVPKTPAFVSQFSDASTTFGTSVSRFEAVASANQKAADTLFGAVTKFYDRLDLARKNVSDQYKAPQTAPSYTTQAVQGFKTGGSFEVAGRAGADKNLVQFMATKGETVNVTKGEKRSDVYEDHRSVNLGGIHLHLANAADIRDTRNRQMIESTIRQAANNALHSGRMKD